VKKNKKKSWKKVERKKGWKKVEQKDYLQTDHWCKRYNGEMDKSMIKWMKHKAFWMDKNPMDREPNTVWHMMVDELYFQADQETILYYVFRDQACGYGRRPIS